MKLDKAKRIADGIVEDLSPFCEHCLIAGSVRRESEEVKDIEIVVLRFLNYPEILASAIRSLGTIKKGDPLKGRYVQVHHYGGIMVDIFIPQPNDFWRIFAMRTGPRSYSQNTIARGWVNIGWVGTEDGLRLSNQCARHGKAGVWKCHVKDPVLPPSWASEEEFFQWLDVPFKHPKDRGVVLEEDIHPRLDIYQKIEAGHFTPKPERPVRYTNGELIAELQKHDPDLPVAIQKQDDEMAWRATSVDRINGVTCNSTDEQVDVLVIWGG